MITEKDIDSFCIKKVNNGYEVDILIAGKTISTFFSDKSGIMKSIISFFDLKEIDKLINT